MGLGFEPTDKTFDMDSQPFDSRLARVSSACWMPYSMVWISRDRMQPRESKACEWIIPIAASQMRWFIRGEIGD